MHGAGWSPQYGTHSSRPQRLRRNARGFKYRLGSTAACVWDGNRHGVPARARLLAPIPSSYTCSPARRLPRGGRRRSLLVLHTEIPDSGHACARQQADRRHCPHGPLPLQSKPDLPGVFHLPARYRELGQQRVADRYTDSGSCRHGVRRDPQRGAVLGKKVRCRLLGLQTFRAPLAVDANEMDRGWLLPGRKRVLPYSIQTLKRLRPAWFRQDLLALFELLRRQKIRPLVAQRFPLAEARQAQELLGKGGVTGKIVLAADAERGASDTK